MIVLTLRTDKPEAEIGIYDGQKESVYETWQAHRQLAETIHRVIAKNLQLASLGLDDLEGIVVFKGPGSFTGLRIGLSVANALADSLEIPIVGATGDDWISEGMNSIINGENQGVVLPEYGAQPHITKPKK